jgi:hypothetical protein
LYILPGDFLCGPKLIAQLGTLLSEPVVLQMKSSQNIQRLGHTKFTSCSSDFVLKPLERASDLKMLISFPFFVCLSFTAHDHDLFRTLSE